VTRWRRPGANEILLAYLLLAAIGFVLNWLSRSVSSQSLLLSFSITALLVWRVSRGGRFSRMILIIVSCASCAVTAWVAIPGCRPTASDACSALAEGYPLRWLTAKQSEPVISKGALLKDCAQWALASTSVLYLAWLRPTASPNRSD
jgi:hypothetical protein